MSQYADQNSFCFHFTTCTSSRYLCDKRFTEQGHTSKLAAHSRFSISILLSFCCVPCQVNIANVCMVVCFTCITVQQESQRRCGWRNFWLDYGSKQQQHQLFLCRLSTPLALIMISICVVPKASVYMLVLSNFLNIYTIHVNPTSFML